MAPGDVSPRLLCTCRTYGSSYSDACGLCFVGGGVRGCCAVAVRMYQVCRVCRQDARVLIALNDSFPLSRDVFGAILTPPPQASGSQEQRKRNHQNHGRAPGHDACPTAGLHAAPGETAEERLPGDVQQPRVPMLRRVL